MFVRIKDFTIYVPIDSAVTIIVTGAEYPRVEEQNDNLDDELQQY
jgi:hypothetical protein